MKQEKSCGCIVINEKNEILLVRHNKGHWGFPKGHIEKGETEVETAIREVKEETNIDVKVNEKFRYSENYITDNNSMKEVVYFLATNKNNQKEAQQEEVSEVKWFNYEDAIKTITYDNSKEILKQLKKDLKEENKC